MRSHSSLIRGNDHSVVGWISTTDVFLFAALLFLITSMFLDAQLAKTPKNLPSDIAALRALVDQRDEQITALNAQVESLNKQRQQLEEKLAQESEKNAALTAALLEIKEALSRTEKAMAALSSELIQTKMLLSDAQTQLKQQQVKFDKQLAELRAIVVSYEVEIKRLERQLKELLGKYDLVLVSHEEKERKRSEEGRVRRELIGLKGEMKDVVIIVDSSGSMLEGNRWQNSQLVLKNWLEYLEMERCLIVVFSTTVQSFPENGKFLTVLGEEGKRNRDSIIQFLQGIKPDGGTNTLQALQRAYEADELDTILLFTDGAPNDGTTVGINKEIVKKIYDLCKDHREIPVNAIGLGDYFQPDFSAFLLQISEMTGGTFIGR
jgi:hypothetical protein